MKSGLLKDWAEPKEEDQLWNAEKAVAFAHAEAQKGSYGAAGMNSVKLNTLPPTVPRISCKF